jgi:hypothetical protein
MGVQNSKKSMVMGMSGLCVGKEELRTTKTGDF